MGIKILFDFSGIEDSKTLVKSTSWQTKDSLHSNKKNGR